MEYRVLGKTGLKVSKLGFGAAPLGIVYDPGGGNAVGEQEAVQSVYKAIDLGVNFIDVAPYYGVTRAETVLGKALRNLPRDSYYLCTKVGRYGFADFDFSAGRVIASVDESLKRLNIEYADIILVHDIEFGSLEQVVNETIPALRRVQAAGKARFLGISGLPLKIFREVVAQTDLDLILSYCHYCLVDTTLVGLVEYLKSKQLGIINASPLSMGLLTQGGAAEWHPASDEIKRLCAAAAQHCHSKGQDISRLALQFSLQQTDFATTLVGIGNPDQIIRNIDAMNAPLDVELLREVQAILAPIHNQTWLSGRPENND